jgi:triphosphoribosyl-dephospho-CoA synthetase
MGAITAADAGWRLRSTPQISPTSIAGVAVNAMQAELHTTPKPGLVDRRDSGAHSDMDYDTFSRAIEAIAPAYREVVRITETVEGETVGPALFEKTRRAGLIAERAMFAATGGINTHKGQIFVLVLLTTATAALRRGLPVGGRGWVPGDRGQDDVSPVDSTTTAIRDGVRYLTRGIVNTELTRSNSMQPIAGANKYRAPTNGERLFRETGATGVRGEAENGFPGIFEVGLPVFAAMLRDGWDRNAAAVNALLSIMTAVEDTTVLHRCGVVGLVTTRRAASEALRVGGVTTPAGRRAIETMNRQFIELGISPGGCADLLAGTFFVYDVVQALHNDVDSR